jgi:peptidyl-prolyl cis-trans isomerase SurA
MATCFWIAPLTTAQAQGLFQPVIKVNEKAITRFEIDQRARLLTLFRSPGDPVETAREQLIEDRLKMQDAENLGLVITEAALLDSMDEFAARGNMELDEMLNALSDAGVEESTFREFVRVGVTWREVISARFGSQVSVNEDDVERARVALSGATGVRVLLSEIVLPIPPGQLEAVLQRAEAIAEIDNQKDFELAARRFSASPTGPTGGRMDWTSISDLPPQLRSIVLGLAPGDVTEPITTEQAIILLQMRDIAETDAPAPRYAEIEYATYFIAGGQTEPALQRAASVRGDVNTCDDLYGIAQGEPASVLERHSKAPDEIPQDVALQLAQLDPGEVNTSLTRNNGQVLVFLMLCGRTPLVEGADGGDGPSVEELTSFVQSTRLESFANGYLAQLRAEARIVGE